MTSRVLCVATLLVGCASTRPEPREPARPLPPQRRCLAWQSYPGEPRSGGWVPGGLFIHGEVTADRGTAFGVQVDLMQGTRVVRRDVIRPPEPYERGAVRARIPGTYSFSGVLPGEYELVFLYGESEVARERLVLRVHQFALKEHLLLSHFSQIPVCA